MSDTDLSGFWAGTYYYTNDVQPAVRFDTEFIQDGSTLSGFITEEDTFTFAMGSILSAFINGTVSEGNVAFTKTYDGRSSAMHAVDYQGSIIEKGKHIKGIWKITQMQGAFEMYRDKGALANSTQKKTETINR